MEKSVSRYRNRCFARPSKFVPFLLLTVSKLESRIMKARSIVRRMEKRPGFTPDLLDIAQSHLAMLESRHLFLRMPEEFSDTIES